MSGDALRIVVPKEVYPAELGAAFLSALAFPCDAKRRDEFAAAMLGEARDGNLKNGKEVPLGVGWLLSQIDRQTLSSALKAGFHVIRRERLIAAKMAYPTVHSTLCDIEGIPRPAVVPAPTSVEMIASVGVDLDERRSNRGRKPKGGASEGNRSNIFARQWKASLPVLHLALSYHFECCETGPADDLNLGDLFFDPDLSERLIRRSITLRPLVADLFGIEPVASFQFFYSN